jgi:uncharacterized protein (TIGR02145 family)
MAFRIQSLSALIAFFFVISCTELKEVEFFTPEERVAIMARGKCESVPGSNAFCYDGLIHEKCNGVEYIPVTHICQNGSARPAKCNNESYNPLEHKCEDGILKNRCGAGDEFYYIPEAYDWYNPATEFCDIRKGGKVYKWVKIDKQVWMAENLNYDVNGGKCYAEGVSGVSADSIAKNCATYGRLYDWATAMNLPQSCNSQLVTACEGLIQQKHQGICPSDWHIPSDADWNALMKFVNPSCSDNVDCDGAGTKLKAKSGWNTGSGYIPGTDDYGFSALPGGYVNYDGNFGYVGYSGHWWSSGEFDSDYAYSQSMGYNGERTYGNNSYKIYLYSVRCVRD